jgi:DNA-3-methyladenine glycosylase
MTAPEPCPPPTGTTLLDRAVLGAHAVDVAPRLLGVLLVHGPCVGRIVEVEAYGGGDDDASHARNGRTARNASMFGPPGTLYVYFTYGMHHCANVVTGACGDGQAVLIRAVEPVAGLPEMRSRRGPAARRDAGLADGPGKVCQAFDLHRRHDGLDLCAPAARGAPMLCTDGTPPLSWTATPRIGIRRATERPWRFVAARR